jgi:hypothetical protein
LPGINALVGVLLADGASYPSRVEGVEDDLFTVAAPFDEFDAAWPSIGTAMDLVWLGEGRLVAPVRLTAVAHGRPPRWVVQTTGAPRRETRRAYMRGGGGEPVRLVRCDGDPLPVEGRVVNIGEGGLRCRLPYAGLLRNEHVDVTVDLDGELVQQRVRVLFVARDPGTGAYDVVMTFESSEALGRTIRGYILRRQMAERRRLAG